MFDSIIKKNKIIDEGHPNSEMDKLKKTLRLLKYSTLNIKKKRKVKLSDTIILTHGRKTLINNKFIDIYLNDIIKELEFKDENYLIIDRPDNYGNHYSPSYDNMIFFERFGHIWRMILHKFFYLKKESIDLIKIINEIQIDIEREFNIKISMMKLIKKRVVRFNFEKKYFEKILNKTKPKRIILAVSYGKEELISLANERNIKVIEVQHGAISNYHMGYYFPYNKPIPYFPDELILFGKYWKDSVNFPINSTQVIKSFSLIKKEKKISKEISEMKVLFISQGSIGKELSKCAAIFANENADSLECIYKLHPSEFSNWKLRYPYLADAEMKKNIKVISDETSIYDLFKICEFSIGVYSTSIYESLMNGCKTFIVGIEGFQNMEYLQKNDYIKLLPNDFKLSELKSFKPKKITNYQYFYE